MRFNSLFKIFASIALASTVLADDIVSLNKNDYEKHLKNTPITLVKYFAPWCGHCQRLAPEYSKAATTLKRENIVLAEVDCTKESEICNKVGIRGYPTLKVYKNGKASEEYQGRRNAESIVDYMKKMK